MRKTTLLLAVFLALAAAQGALGQARRGAAPPGQRRTRATPPDQPEARLEPTLKVDPATWAPADAVVYVGVTDVEKTWNDFKKTAAYQVLSDPAALAAAGGGGPLGSMLADLRGRVADLVGVSAEELQSPLAGPLAFYVTAGESDEWQPNLVAGVGQRELMRTYYGAVVAKLKEMGEYEELTAEGETVNVFTIAKRADTEQDQDDFSEYGSGQPGMGMGMGSPETMLRQQLAKIFPIELPPPKLALCLTEDRLIVASSPEQVRAVLSGQAGVRTMADSEDHAALLKHLRPTGTIRLLVNLPRIIELARAATDESELTDLRQGLMLLGADSLRALVGHVRLGANSYDQKAELLLLMEEQRSGLARLLSVENTPTAPPETVSADTCIYVGCHLDVPRLLDEMERTMREIEPTWADSFRAAMRQQLPDGATLDLRKDFLDHLKAPLLLTFGLAQPLGMNSARLLIGMGHDDQSAMNRVLGNPAVTRIPLMPRDLRGTQVFDLPPMPPVLPAGIVLAATADRLVIGNAAAVEDALAGSSSRPLAQSEAWKRAARFVPERSWLTIFLDSHKTTQRVNELVRSRGDLTAEEPGGMDLGSAIMSGMLRNASADPATAERSLSHAAQAVCTLSSPPEGLKLTVVQLKPEQ